MTYLSNRRLHAKPFPACDTDASPSGTLARGPLLLSGPERPDPKLQCTGALQWDSGRAPINGCARSGRPCTPSRDPGRPTEAPPSSALNNLKRRKPGSVWRFYVFVFSSGFSIPNAHPGRQTASRSSTKLWFLLGFKPNSSFDENPYYFLHIFYLFTRV